jgi:hypothetical protein
MNLVEIFNELGKIKRKRKITNEFCEGEGKMGANLTKKSRKFRIEIAGF